jgi:hypothetical protein
LLRIAFGILESPSVCEYETIDIVIVSSAPIASIAVGIPISLQTCLAQGINEAIYLSLIFIHKGSFFIKFERELKI